MNRLASTLFLLLSLFCVSSPANPIYVHQGDNLQEAINNAQPGETLILDAGATFTGPIILRAKPNSTSYITIQSAGLSLLPRAGQRVSDTDGSNMPKIVSPGFNQPALRTAAAASYYRIIGIEFAPTNANAAVDQTELVALGDGSEAQTQEAMEPHHIILDRCYI